MYILRRDPRSLNESMHIQTLERVILLRGTRKEQARGTKKIKVKEEKSIKIKNKIQKKKLLQTIHILSRNESDAIEYA